MPEGAEVKLFGESLARIVAGKTLSNIKVLSGRYLKKEIEGLTLMNARLPSRVVGIGVHGKFLYWIIENDVFLYNTLGMTGCWTQEDSNHSRVKFEFTDGTVVFFKDQRNFGTIKLLPGRSGLINKLKTLGPDMLSQDVDDGLFTNSLMKRPEWTVAKAIMDQSIIAGVGNYVKSESLYLSQLSPHRTINSLTERDFASLNNAIRAVLREAYKRNGATIQSYKDFEGKEGQYSQKFAVYNQKEDPYGNAVIKEKTEDGRTTHWVPALQK